MSIHHPTFKREHSPLLMDAEEYEYWLDQYGVTPPKTPDHHFRPPVIRPLTPEEREAKAQERAKQEALNPPTVRKYVYIMGCSAGVKIGIAQDVNKRLATIQSMNPIPLTVIHARDAPFPQHLERYLHAEFADFQIRGEWFNLNQHQIDTAISLIDTWDGQ